jgi:hypothetical protein
LKHANFFAGILLVILSALIVTAILAARRGRELFIRRIAGVDAIDEAVGRATEMGRPIFFSVGLGGIDIVTLQAFSIVGHVARMAATFRTRLIVPAADPLAIPVLEEIIRESCNEVGRPEAFNPDDIRFLSDQQFAYAAGCVGIMHREQPATNLLFGVFQAESLILAETGQHIGALQVGGTPSQLQTPFFIATCDYVIIGEEYYATTAYLTREPVLLGSLIGQDRCKMLFLALALLGILMVSFIKPLNPVPTPNLLPPPVYAAQPIAETPFQLTAEQTKSMEDLRLRTVGSDKTKAAAAQLLVVAERIKAVEEQLKAPQLPAADKTKLEADIAAAQAEKTTLEGQIAVAQKEFEDGLASILNPDQKALREKIPPAFQKISGEVGKKFEDRVKSSQQKVDDGNDRLLGALVSTLQQRIQSGNVSTDDIDAVTHELWDAQDDVAQLNVQQDNALKARFAPEFNNLLSDEQKRALSKGHKRYNWVQKIIEAMGG